VFIDDHFGGPANSESPVALRPWFAPGLPFRLLSTSKDTDFYGQVKARGLPVDPSKTGAVTLKRALAYLGMTAKYA
jgi:hypothetical protein